MLNHFCWMSTQFQSSTTRHLNRVRVRVGLGLAFPASHFPLLSHSSVDLFVHWASSSYWKVHSQFSFSFQRAGLTLPSRTFWNDQWEQAAQSPRHQNNSKHNLTFHFCASQLARRSSPEKKCLTCANCANCYRNFASEHKLWRWSMHIHGNIMQIRLTNFT